MGVREVTVDRRDLRLALVVDMGVADGLRPTWTFASRSGALLSAADANGVGARGNDSETLRKLGGSKAADLCMRKVLSELKANGMPAEVTHRVCPGGYCAWFFSKDASRPMGLEAVGLVRRVAEAFFGGALMDLGRWVEPIGEERSLPGRRLEQARVGEEELRLDAVSNPSGGSGKRKGPSGL